MTCVSPLQRLLSVEFTTVNVNCSQPSTFTTRAGHIYFELATACNLCQLPTTEHCTLSLFFLYPTMMRTVIARSNASTRHLRKSLRLERPCGGGTSTGPRPQPFFVIPSCVSSSKCNSYRFLSSKNGVNGDATSGNDNIIESTAATTQWKRNHYAKITDKFQPQSDEDTSNTNNQVENDDTITTTPASPNKPEPENIENYEDVQPMWKEMESRVTRRRSLTLEQMGGVSGRRNVRRSDEDMWLEAGVYEDSDKSKK